MEQYWKDYVLLQDEECSAYFAEKNDMGKTVFILGAGFDERMCAGIGKVSEVIPQMDIWLIRFKEAKNSNSERYAKIVDDNLEQLKQISREHVIVEKRIAMWENEGAQERSVAELNSAKFVKENLNELNTYDSVIIDVSALPQNIYFIILDKLFSELYPQKQMFIIASENYEIDRKTNPVGIEENAHYFWGYGATSAGGNDETRPVIWMPVLGECTEERLQKCYKCIMQDAKYEEICPIVPFPSVNERRSDEILMKFRKLLFDSWNVEKGNIIYASETNPFQLCRRICETAEHYSKVLMALNDAVSDEKESSKFVFTAMTSKLMAVGTFLAAYNLKKEKYQVAIVGLNNRGYRVEEADKKSCGDENRVFCLCLSDKGI